MNKEERHLKKTLGNDNHFRVPEGYLDSLASRVTDSLPDNAAVLPHEKRSAAVLRMLRPAMCAAACICAAVFGITIYFHYMDGQDAYDTQGDTSAYTSGTYSMEDAVIDYAMMDNDEIYSYLADEY